MVPVTTYPTLVGSILLELRKVKKIDQKQMAEAVGVTQSTWSRIEKGSLALTIEQLALAAAAINQMPGAILQYADEAAQQFRARGGVVEYSRNLSSPNAELGLVGAAAIGALIGALLARR